MDKKAIIEEINFLVNKLKESPLSSSQIEKNSQFEVDMLLKISEKLYLQLTILDYLLSSKSEGNEKEAAVNMFKAAFEENQEQIIQESVKPIETPKVSIDLFGGELPSAPAEKPKAEKSARASEEKVVKKEEKPIVSKIQKPKIDNLIAAIGLNDKFQFANELFGGSMQEYNVAIQQLNSAETLESAMDYVANLQQLYDWDFENETVKRLLDLVDRRYSS